MRCPINKNTIANICGFIYLFLILGMNIYYKYSELYVSAKHVDGQYAVTISRTESYKWMHTAVTWKYDDVTLKGKYKT